MGTIEQVQLNIAGGIKYIAEAFQSVAKPQFPDALREWLECQDFMLGMKAINIGMLPVNTESLRYFPTAAQDVISVPHYRNKTIFEAVKPFFSYTFNASEGASDVISCVSSVTKSALEQLRVTPLKNKREVLRYMQIIPTSIAAAYIGVSEHALAEWKSAYETFGANYAGAHCYSLEELKMIANNRFWIYSELRADETRLTPLNDEKLLDEVVLVDYEIGCAFTGMTYKELCERVPRNQLAKRPYRLSDLEKIRATKLNDQEQ